MGSKDYWGSHGFLGDRAGLVVANRIKVGVDCQ